MPTEIRNYVTTDLEECGKLFLEIFGPNGCGESWTLETSIQHVSDNTGSPEYCFVAVEQGKIIGLVLAMPVAREMNFDIFIDTLGVLSSSQGQHIGSSLMDKVKEIGKANGAKHIRLLGNKKFMSFDWYLHKGLKPSGWVELEQSI